MSDMHKLNRREFLKTTGKYSFAALVGGYLLDADLIKPNVARAAMAASVFVAKHGTPAENVAKVIDMRYGGIHRFIGPDDVVVINPNGQWPQQGGSNCACCMGLIDLILQRPGGFAGEILFVECVQFQNEMGSYWGTNSVFPRNGPYNFNDMIAHYHGHGHTNVNGIRILRNQDNQQSWPVVMGPQDGQGWVRPAWQSPTTGTLFFLSYPIIRSPYSQRLIDLKHGVYDNGYSEHARLRFIKMPNLNNHGSNAQQDYAGITSAVKSFLGIAELENAWHGPFNDGIHWNLHTYENVVHGASGAQRAYSAGEAIGAWMNHCRKPDAVITTAEWVGWGSRTGSDATQARTVALCDDPVSLDYIMAKHVMAPLCPSQPYFDPDHDIANNMTRQTINGCISQGHGTANEAEIATFVYDFDAPRIFRFDIDRKIHEFQQGLATQQEVLDMIEQFNQQ
jgi:hypothetical protein